MNKRLRKKKHVGEFKQYGFELKIKLKPGHTQEEINDDFFDRLIAKIEAASLSVGGGGHDLEVEFFVMRCGPRRGKWWRQDSAAEGDREVARAIAESFPEFVESVDTGLLVDAWGA
jgi:uncharacterized protein